PVDASGSAPRIGAFSMLTRAGCRAVGPATRRPSPPPSPLVRSTCCDGSPGELSESLNYRRAPTRRFTLDRSFAPCLRPDRALDLEPCFRAARAFAPDADLRTARERAFERVLRL